MCPDKSGPVGAAEHVRVSVGVSALVSVAAAFVTWGITWGVYSQRLATAEANQNRSQDEIRQESSMNQNQEAKIAVLSAQYGEILRRLDTIDKKLDSRR